MPLKAHKPIIYLITSGETTVQTTSASEKFSALLKLVAAAVAANVTLLQLREKNLSTRVLYELAIMAAGITRGSDTRLIVNDRADVASAAGADGVHLTTTSLETEIVRRTFGDDFLIGLSTHSPEEARAAGAAGADFAVLGPIFETASKRMYGEPLGSAKLEQVANELGTFPMLALGGVTLGNAAVCFRAGASGIAAIRLLRDPDRLAGVVQAIRAAFREQQNDG
jgi:thiamine-phosphate pyrophosphorylase